MNEFAPSSAAARGLARCEVCAMVSPVEAGHCPRCGSRLHLRLRESLQRTWALTIAAFLLYFPANLLPILRIDSVTGDSASTIIGGVIQFWQQADYPIAIIIFTASVMIPVLKIISIVTLCLAARSGRHPGHMTRLYRVTEFIGRWSMVDVFVVAILVAVVQLGSTISIHPGAAALSFAGVVVLTMLAAMSFRSAFNLGRRETGAIMTNHPPPNNGTPARPVVKKSGNFSPIWIIPVVAALLGLWLAFKYYSGQGPEISVRFETAEGIVQGKTPVLCRSVNIGTVDKVHLTKDLKGVIVTMQMTSEATDLLTKDTQIWVVRPRYGGAAGISGLSTIVSGSYIALEPGISHESRRDFVGLEQPPVTPKGVPGLHITFFTDEAGSIGPGAPILYKGLEAGRIESRTFHPENGKIEFGAFISKKFASLVRKNTKFWNASGVDVSLGADGLQLHTGSLETLLFGGITFDGPEAVGSRARGDRWRDLRALRQPGGHEEIRHAKQPALSPPLFR